MATQTEIFAIKPMYVIIIDCTCTASDRKNTWTTIAYYRCNYVYNTMFNFNQSHPTHTHTHTPLWCRGYCLQAYGVRCSYSYVQRWLPRLQLRYARACCYRAIKILCGLAEVPKAARRKNQGRNELLY